MSGLSYNLRYKTKKKSLQKILTWYKIVTQLQLMKIFSVLLSEVFDVKCTDYIGWTTATADMLWCDRIHCEQLQQPSDHWPLFTSNNVWEQSRKVGEWILVSVEGRGGRNPLNAKVTWQREGPQKREFLQKASWKSSFCPRLANKSEYTPMVVSPISASQ